MNEKEKYSKYIINVNGKDCFGHDLKTNYEEKLFGENPDKAFALVKDDLKYIELFSQIYLSAHPEIVNFVIETVFEEAIATRFYNSFDREYLKRIPYPLLRSNYNKIREYVNKDGLLLALGPNELQNDFLQIPYEAVCQNAQAVLYASKEALLS